MQKQMKVVAPAGSDTNALPTRTISKPPAARVKAEQTKKKCPVCGGYHEWLK